MEEKKRFRRCAVTAVAVSTVLGFSGCDNIQSCVYGPPALEPNEPSVVQSQAEDSENSEISQNSEESETVSSEVNNESSAQAVPSDTESSDSSEISDELDEESSDDSDEDDSEENIFSTIFGFEASDNINMSVYGPASEG